MIQPYIYIKTSANRGRGVFTKKPIPAKTEIEVSPALVLSAKDREIVNETRLYHYIFEWGVNKKRACVALGYVSMYNHSYEANCEYEMDYKTEFITIRTLRPIKRGEELYINYNAVWNDKTPVWFSVK